MVSKTEHKSRILTGLARAAIAARLQIEYASPDAQKSKWLQVNAATFVTLQKQGQLRGCIGTLDAYRPLIEDVQANALAAAFQDPRFDPLQPDEFHLISIEVSVLSALEPIHVRNEEFAYGKLRPNRDGVVFSYHGHRATFLPQVWEQLPDAKSFLAQLKLKAGLPGDFWHPEVLLFRYQVDKYREQEE